jgi:hypothetical protein
LKGFTKNKSALIILLFLGAQLIIDLMGSVTAFPFLHYGMYSEVFDSKRLPGSYHITVNGEVLNANAYSISEWEMITTPISLRLQYLQSKDFKDDKLLLSHISSKIGLEAISHLEHLDNPQQSDVVFKSYYQNHLSKIISEPIQTLSIEFVQYQYKNAQYIPVDTISILL